MRRLIRFALILTLSLTYFPTAQSSTPSTGATENWFHGAAGYERAIQLQKELNLPVVVYFWAGWCPYCQALDSKYLPTAPVQEYLREVIKVRIYPEQGPAERELAKQYNVQGYPSFFIIRNASAKPKKVHPFRGSKNLTPEQFAEACRAAGPISNHAVAAKSSSSNGVIIARRPDEGAPAVTQKRNSKGGMQIVTVVPGSPR